MTTIPPRLPADTARCAGTWRDECQSCLRKLSPPHERQVWIGPWVLEDERCPSRIPASVSIGKDARLGSTA